MAIDGIKSTSSMLQTGYAVMENSVLHENVLCRTVSLSPSG